ncbi:MAG: prepilin peptidase [Lachnospiraceae bacterium]|nr:prepilin peptidase [Lachnospiraceae bacterium]
MGYVLNIFTGVCLGTACCALSGLIERHLSKKRGLSTESTKIMKVMTYVFSVICGICIMLFMPSTLMAVYAFILLVLAEVSGVMDIRHRIIPNETVIALMAVKAVFIVLSLLGLKDAPKVDILSSLIGFAACFIIFLLPSFFGKNVGSGDIKLAAAIGFCLGFKGAFTAVALMGGLVLIYMFLRPRVPVMAMIKKTIPMGPFLSAGMVAVCILTGYGLI